jgi:hypothetical protein
LLTLVFDHTERGPRRAVASSPESSLKSWPSRDMLPVASLRPMTCSISARRAIVSSASSRTVGDDYPCNRAVGSLLCQNYSLFVFIGNIVKGPARCCIKRRSRRRPRPIFANFPVSREFEAETGSQWTASSGSKSTSNQLGLSCAQPMKRAIGRASCATGRPTPTGRPAPHASLDLCLGRQEGRQGR